MILCAVANLFSENDSEAVSRLLSVVYAAWKCGTLDQLLTFWEDCVGWGGGFTLISR